MYSCARIQAIPSPASPASVPRGSNFRFSTFSYQVAGILNPEDEEVLALYWPHSLRGLRAPGGAFSPNVSVPALGVIVHSVPQYHNIDSFRSTKCKLGLHVCPSPLALPVGASKWLVDANNYFYGGRVASLVKPLPVDHYASVHTIGTAVRKKEWPKDRKLHSQGK
ncbi:hypothetical protein BC827DRAFT_1159348 [Russula dissimulans]|nr:hypothetical protein BC827DRAFT_1159348 [Russula dissimulans]